MKYYLAPLEGITTNIYRKVYHKHYAPMDKYFTPFISPHTKKLMDPREKRDILPENNKGLKIVPQVLTNKAEDLIDFKFVNTLDYPIYINAYTKNGTLTIFLSLRLVTVNGMHSE